MRCTFGIGENKVITDIWTGILGVLTVAVKASSEIAIVRLNTNRVLSGTVELPVELHFPANQVSAGVYFLLDGKSSPSIENPNHSDESFIVGHWDTTEVSNGWHTLQAFASYPTGRNENGGYEEYTGQVVRVKTFNAIVFEETLNTFGTNNKSVPFVFPIRATSSIATAQWKVTISTLSNQVLRVLTGATTNGAIETNWDGNDANGTRIRDSVDIEVETIPTNDKTTGVGH